MENLFLDREGMFQEIVERGRIEGVADQAAYHELCENQVNDHLDVGELDKDQNLSELIEELKNRWPDFQEALDLE